MKGIKELPGFFGDHLAREVTIVRCRRRMPEHRRACGTEMARTAVGTRWAAKRDDSGPCQPEGGVLISASAHFDSVSRAG